MKIKLIPIPVPRYSAQTGKIPIHIPNRYFQMDIPTQHQKLYIADNKFLVLEKDTGISIDSFLPAFIPPCFQLLWSRGKKWGSECVSTYSQQGHPQKATVCILAPYKQCRWPLAVPTLRGQCWQEFLAQQFITLPWYCLQSTTVRTSNCPCSVAHRWIYKMVENHNGLSFKCCLLVNRTQQKTMVACKWEGSRFQMWFF